MRITDWPTTERPREKLLNRGISTLSDAELLAIFLRTGIQGKTAVDLARQLLRDFGGLRQLLTADLGSFCQIKGLGVAKFCQLQAALELGHRHLYQHLLRENVLKNPAQTSNYIRAQLREHNQEVFACLFLDNQYRVITFETLFHGTLNRTVIYPREVVRATLKYNAAAVIFAHNHPSGLAKASQADYQTTKLLCKALETIDVKVLDHLIIGEGMKQITSLAEEGFFP